MASETMGYWWTHEIYCVDEWYVATEHILMVNLPDFVLASHNFFAASSCQAAAEHHAFLKAFDYLLDMMEAE